jgi:hypothetical protein
MNKKSKTQPMEPSPAPVQERKWTQDELEDYQRMRHNKLNNPVEFRLPGIYIPEQSDAQMLDFLSLVVVDSESALRKIADAAVSGDEHAQFWAIAMAEAITAARAVARRAIYYGLRSAPEVEDEKEGRSREPILLELRGFSGLRAYDDSRLLYHIGSVLYYFREDISRQIRSKLTGEAEVRMVEALAIAQIIEDRGCGVDEVEAARAKGTRTALEEQVWTFKAIQAMVDPQPRK